MDYQKFRKEYEASGLTQRAYGAQISMSSSMVSYYLRKTKREQGTNEIPTFHEVRLLDESTTSKEIKITTPSGMEIVIPIC